MTYRENLPLSTLTTMRLDGLARYVVEVTTTNELVVAIKFARDKNLPWFVLGGGSNVIAGDDYDGVIILNRIKGFEKLDEDENSVTYRIGAGEVWDSAVERLCAENLSGVECMSAIPGTAGATPVQNAGAFGQEIADALVELTAFDTIDSVFVTLSHTECGFSYRNSIFKSQKDRHYIICDITLRLSRQVLRPPFYPALQTYFDENGIHDFSPQAIRGAVIKIRASKLPNPREIASAGSFFKNPIVSRDVADNLLAEFPDAPCWGMPNDCVKLAAGWLIDMAGLRGYTEFGFQLYPKNALVITNLSAKSIADLEKFKSEIIMKVQGKFGVTLEQEPENL